MLRGLRLTLVIIAVGLGQAAAAQPAPGGDEAKRAARHFADGEKLYNVGKFALAIEAFTRAQALAPHASTLFNIARCHENMGQTDSAMAFYRKVLGTTSDPAMKAEIQARMRRIESRPVKVFVNSVPPGAAVTVDGRKDPAPGKTPLVLALSPGEHVLLVKLRGYRLAAKRIDVAVGQEATHQVKLFPEPVIRDDVPPPTPKCSEQRLTDPLGLHLHLSVAGAFGAISALDLASGLGLQILATYRNLVFGAQFLWFPLGKNESTGTIGDPSFAFESSTSRWMLTQAEGGYLFAFKNFYVTTTVGLGLSAERTIFVPDEKNSQKDFVIEEFAFAWSLGGGIEAMATRWLSFGASVRFGMLHGNRVNHADPAGERRMDGNNFPFATLWGSVTLHL